LKEDYNHDKHGQAKIVSLWIRISQRSPTDEENYNTHPQNGAKATENVASQLLCITLTSFWERIVPILLQASSRSIRAQAKLW
jgi:hypothetical protein